MFIFYPPFNYNQKLIHARNYKESSLFSPSNKKNKKALEFCQHLVFRVRKMSALGPCVIQDTVF